MEREGILAIRRKYGDDKLLKCKGAFGVDVDYKRVKGKKTDKLGITVYVKKKIPKGELIADEVVPTEIDGVSTDVVECANIWPTCEMSELAAVDAMPQISTDDSSRQGSYTPQPAMRCGQSILPHCGVEHQPIEVYGDSDPDNDPDFEPEGNKLRQPLIGGLGISNQFMADGPCTRGTLGIILTHEGSNTPAALSCAHVMVSSKNAREHVIEPTWKKGGKYPADGIGHVSSYKYENDVEVALVSVHRKRRTVPGYVDKIGPIVGFADPVEQQDVRKMGIATGLTQGLISSTNLTVTTSSQLGQITFDGYIRIENPHDGTKPFARKGDSGAAVVTCIDDRFYMVGMVVAGNDEFVVVSKAANIAQFLDDAQIHFP